MCEPLLRGLGKLRLLRGRYKAVACEAALSQGRHDPESDDDERHRFAEGIIARSTGLGLQEVVATARRQMFALISRRRGHLDKCCTQLIQFGEFGRRQVA